MKPLRILHVFASLDRGGAETMIMNMYRKIDREQIQLDFVVVKRDKEYAYEEEIKSLGGRIFPLPRYALHKTFSYRKAWRQLLINHPEWQILHVHHASVLFAYCSIAKSLGRKIIAHSHNSGDDTVKAFAKKFTQFSVRYKADYLFACSHIAAKWMFGKYSDKARIIKNAIDCGLFDFSDEKRAIKRQELNLNDKFVIGHVGSFRMQKNHAFVVDVFAQIKKYIPNATLLFVGDGELKQSIQTLVQKMNLSDVVFLGVCPDIPELLCAMDVFLFPSISEGFGIAILEAQATGLPCVVSNAISDEVMVTDLVKSLSLRDSLEKWVASITAFRNGESRISHVEKIKNAGYDVIDEVKKLTDFYVTLASCSATSADDSRTAQSAFYSGECK